MNQQNKIELVEHFKTIKSNYKTIILLDITGIPTDLIKKIKKKTKEGIFKQVKSSLLSLIFNKEIKGTNLLFLTNLTTIDAIDLLESQKLHTIYKVNEIADTRLIIKAGVTNIRPSLFTRLLEKIANLKVEKGFIAFKDDFVVFKPGSVITDINYQIMKEFDYKPKSKFLKINYILNNNLEINPDSLKLIYTLPILLENLSSELSKKLESNFIYSVSFIKKELKVKLNNNMISQNKEEVKKTEPVKQVKKEEEFEDIFI